MRILTVCTSTNVFGAEVITLKMLEGFKLKGHEQLAVTSIWTDGEFNRRLAIIGIPEIRLPFGTLSKRLSLTPLWYTVNVVLRLPRLWLAWIAILKRFKPDVIIFSSSRVMLPVYMWLRGQRSFLIEHGFLDPTPTRRRLYRVLASKLVAFVAVSDFMAQHLIRMGAPSSQIRVVRNGPFLASDILRIEKQRAREVLAPERTPRLGIIGQIASNKGHETLIQAAQLLKRRGLELEVSVFGKGAPEYLAKLGEMVASAGLTAIWQWMGYKADPATIYGQIDICVMPSANESFGMVAVEASAYRLPVVASNRGGLPEIIEDGVTGWLVEPDSPVELADRIGWLIENPVEARAMGEHACRRALHNFTTERMVQEFEELFVAAAELGANRSEVRSSQ